MSTPNDTETAEREHEQHVRNLVDAIEAFVDAKIALARCENSSGPGKPQARTDVNETREHMRDKLAELVK